MNGRKDDPQINTSAWNKTKKAFDRQVDGDHYTTLKIQPAVYGERNNLSFLETSVVKYVSRHKSKNGQKDLEKAIHCLEMLIDLNYGEGEKI